MKKIEQSKALLAIAAISVSCLLGRTAEAGEDKPRVLSIAEAEAVAVAMQHESAERCKVKECFLLVSSDGVYSKITLANRVEFDLGNDQLGVRYINGVTLYVNNTSKRIDKVVLNR